MRAWWSENWAFVIGGIVVGVIIVGGMYQYRNSTAQAEATASTLFEDVMYASGTGDLDAAEAAAAADDEQIRNNPKVQTMLDLFDGQIESIE